MDTTFNLKNTIDQIVKEKGIDKKIVLDALEQAVLTAANKKYRNTRDLEAHFNEEIGEVELLVPIKLENLGTLEMMPGELYVREVANSLLHLRLKDREAFRRSQLAARMRLWAWNKGEK